MIKIVKLLILIIVFNITKNIKYNKQIIIVKNGSNSTFGFLGAGGNMIKKEDNSSLLLKAMFQVMPISACITFLGRYCTETCKNYIEKKGYIIRYGDTDSLFIDYGLPNTHEGLIKSFELTAPIVKELSDMFPGTMKIEHEKTAKTILFFKSKMYSMYKF